MTLGPVAKRRAAPQEGDAAPRRRRAAASRAARSGAATGPAVGPRSRRKPTEARSTADDASVPGRAPNWSGRIIAICLAVYAILAVAVFLPASPFSSSTVPTVTSGNPSWQDPFQMMWFLSYVPYALTHGAPLFHTTLIDSPRGVNLADNTWVPILGIAGWPITATLGPVATFNFLLRLSFFVSAGSMFLVLRRWCSSWQGPFVAGLLYAFSPYMAAQELHLDLNFVPIPPLLLLLGDELVRRQRMRPITLGVLIGVACAVQFLLSPDVLSGCAVMAILIAAVLAVRFRRQLKDRIPYIAKSAAVTTGVFGLIAGFPIFEMLAGTGHLSGPVIAVRRLQYNSVDLLGPITPTSHQLLTGGLASLGDRMVNTNLSENGAYLGIPLIILLGVIVRKLRKDAFVAIAAFGAIAALILSFGAHLVAADRTSAIPMPGYVLTRIVLLENTIPARYSLYVVLFASAILAIGIDRLWPSLWAAAAPSNTASKAKSVLMSRRTGLVGIAVVVAVTIMPAVPFSYEALPWAQSLPATLARILPKGAVIATIPEASPQDAEPMAWQALDGMRFELASGYANVQSPYLRVGQRWPYPGEPYFLLGNTPIPTYPIPYTPAVPLSERTQVAVHELYCSYIQRHSIDALVFAWLDQSTGRVVIPQGMGIEDATRAIGRPNVVAHGYVIWLTAGRCAVAQTASTGAQ